MADHQAGEHFVLLDAARLRRLPLSRDQVGALIKVTPLGLGDAGSAVELVATGEAMRPVRPARLNAAFTAGGGLSLTWLRRSRRGWAWLDEVDAPLEFSAERYRVTLSGTLGSIVIEAVSPQASVSASEVASLGAGPVKILVVQVGDFAVSHPAALVITV
jgi:hypothetical protein